MYLLMNMKAVMNLKYNNSVLINCLHFMVSTIWHLVMKFFQS